MPESILNLAGTASRVRFFRQVAARGVKRAIVRSSIAIAALVLVTLVCYRLHFNLATASLLYVVVIVITSGTGDLASSIVASIVAAVCLAHLAPPAYSFRVSDPLDDVAIAVFFVTAFVISHLVSALRRMREEALSSVSRRLIDAEERERTRIARELHDDIGQRLALVIIHLEGLSAEGLGAGLEGSAAMKQLSEQLTGISKEIQALAHNLHSPKLEYLGLTTTVKSLCSELRNQYKVQIDFRGHEFRNGLAPDISLSLFRVAQEALHNSVKHSGTRQVEVELFEKEDDVHLIVRDKGHGFDLERATKGKGLGLVSMRERLKLVKGELSIDSHPGRGTTVHATVPVTSASTSSHTAA